MKRKQQLRIVSILVIALFVLSLQVTTVHAYTFPRSVNVAMVPDNGSTNGGSLYTGASWPDSLTFTFTNLSPSTIRDAVNNPLTSYDTIMLMTSDFDFGAYWANAQFSGRITNFVNGGGKLIIYVSESMSSYYDSFDNFIYPFHMVNPGQTGNSGGKLINVADDTLSSNSSAADTYPNGLQSYINIPLIVSGTDAVGDLTVMTSYNSNWYLDMTGVNTYNQGGPAHTYAFYGSGLIIFNGLDIDYGSASYAPSNSGGRNALQMIWWRELCGQTLGSGQSVSGLTLTPATAINNLGTQHTVTATVRDIINNPVASVMVNFTIISGPNIGLKGSVVTDAAGQATFTWTGNTVGTDVIQAAIVNAAGATVTTTAQKTWGTPTNDIPEVPIGTIAALASICIAFAVFAAKGKMMFKPRV